MENLPPMVAMLTMAASPADLSRRAEHVGERGVGGVEGGEEVGGHGAAVGFEGLVLDGADLDDAGVVDEDVDAAEVVDGVVDEVDGLSGVGEVGGDEEDVVGGLDGLAFDEEVTGADELVEIAGGEDEFGSGAAEALGEGEAEAAGGPGDDDDLVALRGAGLESVGCCCGDDAGEELGGEEGGAGLLHHGQLVGRCERADGFDYWISVDVGDTLDSESYASNYMG